MAYSYICYMCMLANKSGYDGSYNKYPSIIHNMFRLSWMNNESMHDPYSVCEHNIITLSPKNSHKSFLCSH